jgi:hypothetical protein
MTTAAPPTSLIEIVFGAAAKSMARRRQARTARGTRSAVGEYLAEVLGTLLAMSALTVAAFAVAFALGMAVAGVALLLLDFKVAMVRRARAARGGRR